MPHTAYCPSWLKYFKLKTDFFSLLRAQAQTTVDGLRALHLCMSSAAKEGCKQVHELEHKADRQKMEIETQLRDTFVTPFDREEIYDLSARLDLIINGAKRIVKDIEFFKDCPTDAYLVKMSERLVVGGEDLLGAFEHLDKDLASAEESANKARKTETGVGEIYRQALTELVHEQDFSTRIENKHLYDCLSVIAERIERLGEVLLHISIQLG